MRAVFSMNVPVPPEQALCIRTCLLFVFPLPLKKIVFISSPPISLTKRTAGCSRSTLAATATTSWMTLAPTAGSDQPGSRAGKEDAIALRSEVMLRFEPRQKLQDFFRLLGIVPLVGLGNHFAGRRGENVFDRGASHVHAADLRAVGAGLQLLRRLDFHHARVPHQGRDLNEIPVSHGGVLSSGTATPGCPPCPC